MYKINQNQVLHYLIKSFIVFSAYVLIIGGANALPVFARQTGQSCVACHAGGQFPELTPYGRYFKLMAYTAGERTLPLSVMGVIDVTKTQNNTDDNGDISAKDSRFIPDIASVFVAGKITDNVGLFSQFTYSFPSGHLASDNFDIRFADRIIIPKNDFIWGMTIHNNPMVQDVWNSATAWGYPYLSTSQGQFAGLPFKTLLESGTQMAGTGAYVYWRENLYLEASAYQTANNVLSFLSLGSKDGSTNYPLAHIDGLAPYLRVAYTDEWGANNIMVGAFMMKANITPLDGNSFPTYGAGTTNYFDRGIDAQYQYLLAPHTVTAHFRYINESIDDQTQSGALGYTNPNAIILNSVMAKVSYTYQAKYGASLAYRSIYGTADPAYAINANNSSIAPYGSSASRVPNSSMWIPEIYYTPVQNIRIGLQYSYFTQYLGGNTFLDNAGNQRNASDNNTLFLYLWAAY